MSIIAFYVILALLVYKHRKNIEFHKIFLLFKTKRGIELMTSLSKSRFWKYYGYAAIPVGFAGMIFILYFLVTKLIKFLMHPQTAEKTLQIILPWDSAASSGPFLFVPFWTFLTAIAILVIVHEGSHGVVALAHKLKLKSTGLGMFLFIPLAFVEPDEKQLEKASTRSQLSVFAAGPFANFCTAAIFLAIFTFMITPASNAVFINEGIHVVGLEPDQPAILSGLEVGDIILSVNGQETHNMDEFVNVMTAISPEEEITILTNTKEVTLTTGANKQDSSRAHIGVSILQNQEPKESYGSIIPKILLSLQNLFYWVILFNIGIGLFNLLPLGPVDGGRMLKSLLLRLIKDEKVANKLWVVISTFTLLVLIASFIGSALA